MVGFIGMGIGGGGGADGRGVSAGQAVLSTRGTINDALASIVPVADGFHDRASEGEIDSIQCAAESIR
jgi:hypothetical protein